ncbi:MAG: hypothetical protein AAGC81_07185 [Pseudomonadota bacterium]
MLAEDLGIKKFLKRLTGAAELRIMLGLVSTALAVWITIALWPYPPLTDRSDPEYAERFAAAEYLVDDEPGLDELSLRKVQKAIPKVMEKIRASHPELTDEQALALKADMLRRVEEIHERTRLGFRHFWAETLNTRDLRLLSYHGRPFTRLLDFGLSWDPRRTRAGLAVLNRRSELETMVDYLKALFRLQLVCGSYEMMTTWEVGQVPASCNVLGSDTHYR